MKVLICEDHLLMRRGLLRLLTSLFPPTLNFLEAENGWQAIDLMQQHPDVNVILLDIQMAELNGIDTLREMRKRGWKTPVIVLTQYDEQALVQHLLELGISGYLHKNSDPAELAAAIRMAVAGGVFYNDLLPDEKSAGEARNLNFSARELEIVQLLAAGLTSREIGTHLNLSTDTVDEHRQRILQKTNTRNVAELVGLAARVGML
ncbi:MAG: response regulator [Cyclobacteriaceae bacterium]|nr:response regulator [Cyclobacteriaceae bacterium]